MNPNMSNQQVDKMSLDLEDLYGDNEGVTSYPEEVKTVSGTSNVVRILDGSNSYQKYLVSWFMCDDDIIRSFIVENEHQGASILLKILGDPKSFYRGGYLESRKVNNIKVFIHEAADREVFKRINEYFNPAYSGYGSARPKREFVFNVIHRNPTMDGANVVNWCVENKHTKLMRFGTKAFQALKDVRDNCGEFDMYDIVFSKRGSGPETVYSVLKADVNTPYNKIGPLTEEEKNYTRYDLKEITRLPSANYILRHLKYTIERIDHVMKTHFLEELQKQAEMEASGSSTAQQQTLFESSPAPSFPSIRTPNKPRGVVPNVNVGGGIGKANQPTQSTVGIQPNAPTDNPFDDSAIPFVAGSSKASTNQRMAKKAFVSPEVNVNMPQSQFESSSNEQMSICSECGKLFSSTAAQCPHCGQIYA